jgi:hypothetical protein
MMKPETLDALVEALAVKMLAGKIEYCAGDRGQRYTVEDGVYVICDWNDTCDTEEATHEALCHALRHDVRGLEYPDTDDVAVLAAFFLDNGE